MAHRVAVFDLYGTLLDLGALTLAAPANVDGKSFVASWRAKQLEYSWTHIVMRRRASFELLTEQALDWTLSAYRVRGRTLRSALLDAYRALPAQPDAEPCLRLLRSHGVHTAVLSNGSEDAIRNGLDRAQLAKLLDDVLSVDAVGVFKPDQRVYRFAAETLAVAPSSVAFQTSNPWDAAGADAAGLTVHWINRSGAPDEYDLRGTVGEFPSLTAVASAIAAR